MLFKFHAGDTLVGKEFEKDGFAFLPGSIKNSWIVRLPGNGGARLPGTTVKKTQGQQAEPRTSFQHLVNCEITIHAFGPFYLTSFSNIHRLTS